MNKMIIGLCLMLFLIPTHAQKKGRKSSTGQHRWSVFTGLLVQSGPFREFAQLTPSGIYGQSFNVWEVGTAGMGISIGGAYDYTFNNKMKFRLQAQLESTGWIAGIIDIGFGARLPMPKGISISFDTYFSVSQTGGKLGLYNAVNFIDGTDPKQMYMGLFGFKGRVAVEFPIKGGFIAPYVSYAVYPWFASNIEDLAINGFQHGALIDSLQVGIEFGSKF